MPTTDKTAAGAHAPVIPRDSAANLARDLRLLIDESYDWLLTHWLQVVIAAAIGTAIVVALIGLRTLGKRLCRDDAIERPTVTAWPVIIGNAIAKTRLWFMIALAAKLVVSGTNPPAALLSVVGGAFTIASALQCAIWAREIILGAVEHRAGEDIEHSAVGSAMGIIRLLVTIAIFRHRYDPDPRQSGRERHRARRGARHRRHRDRPRCAGHLRRICSRHLAIIFDRPFRRGDSDPVELHVRLGGGDRPLNRRAVRALTGEQIVIANKALLDKELHNFARLDRRRMSFTLGVTYETPVDVLEGIPALVRGIVEGTEKCSVVRCGFTTFGASSLDFALQIDVHSENYNEVFDTTSRLGLAILRAFNDAGIAFAYPTQTSYTAAPGGKIVNPWPPLAEEKA